MSCKRQRFNGHGFAHGFSSRDGAKHNGRLTRYDGTDGQNGHVEDDERDKDRRLIERIIAPPVLHALLEVFVLGVNLAELAHRNGTHRGTEGRRLRNLAETAKRGLLAVIAYRTIEKGADRFIISPQSGGLVERLDTCAVTMVGLMAKYNHVPSVEEIHSFVVDRQGVLFGEQNAYLGGWRDLPTHEWVLEVLHVYPTEAVATAAASLHGRASIFHLQARQSAGSLQSERKAA